MFFLLGIISCSQNKKEETKIMRIKGETSDTYSSEKIEEYKQRIISEGDDYAYGRLMEHYDNEENYDSLLKYSYLMADKYGYADANYDIAWGILYKELETDDFGLLDRLSPDRQKIVIERLTKGAELDDIDCLVTLLSYYEKTGDKKKADEIDKRLEEISSAYKALKKAR